MTATASIMTTEIRRRPDGVAVFAENSVKTYENWFVAKEALDELLILWLTTLVEREYKLTATRAHFQIEVADDNRLSDLTRYIDVFVVLDV